MKNKKKAIPKPIPKTDELFQLIVDLSESWGKTPIVLKDVPGDKGFIGNRIMAAVRRESMKIIEEGVGTADDITLAMTLGFRWPAGPFPQGPSARRGREPRRRIRCPYSRRRPLLLCS